LRTLSSRLLSLPQSHLSQISHIFLLLLLLSPLPHSASEGGDLQAKEEGRLIIAFSTGQILHISINAEIALPFLTASSPGMFFGMCQVSKNCEGMFLLQNPTNVPAKWSFNHEPNDPSTVRVSNIHVQGYIERGPDTDDPSVFEITPGSGLLLGPTLSAASAMGAPAKDFNRT
jgi:hypothetical protein